MVNIIGLVRLSAMAVVYGLVLMSPSSAQAQDYSINGRPATPQEEARMYADGLPFGDYWYDVSSGYWGMVGDPRPLGHFNGGGGGGGGGQRHQSLSERGLLNTPPLIVPGVGGILPSH
jgi:hypothetical protein